MKTLRQLFVASVFTLALTLSAFAGEIQTPKTQPTPVTTEGEIQTPLTGQTETNGSVSEATAIDSATEIALNLLQSVLSLF
jgi:hypothetical protein